MKGTIVQPGQSPYDGARIENKYLDRQKEIIAVDKNDLNAIMDLDGFERSLIGLGLFLLSGALWLGIDKATIKPFTLTPILAICGCSVITGAILLIVGWKMGSLKRGKIQQIYKETTPRI